MENNNALTYKGTTPRDTERTVDEQWTVERLLAMDVKSRIVSMGREQRTVELRGQLQYNEPRGRGAVSSMKSIISSSCLHRY